MKFSSLTFLFVVAAKAWADEKKTALIVVDVQDCFMEAAGTASGQDGSLAVADTAEIIPIINKIRTEKSCLFDVVVRSQDYHTIHHISFGPTHGLEPFAHLSGKGELPLTCINPSSGLTQDASCCPTYHIAPYDCETMLCPSVSETDVRALSDVLESPACTVCKDTPDECFETTQAMWTNHCLQKGDSTFPPSLYTEDADIIVQKGGNRHVDSYSAFMDNTRKLMTPLDEILKTNNVGTIYILGIATDYCVYFSTIDAIGLGYQVNVVLDATRGIANETMDAAVADMKAQGATIIDSATVLNTQCDDPSSAVAALSLRITMTTIWALLLFVLA